MIGFATFQFVVYFVSLRVLAQETYPGSDSPSPFSSSPGVIDPTGTDGGSETGTGRTSDTPADNHGAGPPTSFEVSFAASSEELNPVDVDSSPWSTLKSATDITKCLATRNPQPIQWEPVRVALCDPTEEGHQWRFVVGLTSIKSALNDGNEWCLDGGEAISEVQTVTISKCKTAVASQMWWFTGEKDGHFAMYNQSRCLDLTDGKTGGNGHLQTYQCFCGNTNQMWGAEVVNTQELSTAMDSDPWGPEPEQIPCTSKV